MTVWLVMQQTETDNYMSLAMCPASIQFRALVLD